MNRWLCCCAACCAMCVVGLAANTPSEKDEPFKAIPAADLNRQIDVYLQGFSTAVADSDTYEGESRRVMRDAYTLAVLATLLANHESDHPRKAVCGALVEAAQKLAAAKDFQSAKTALAQVQAVVAGGMAPGGPLKKDVIAPQGQLMKQVTFVNNRLRRNMRRFDDKTEDLALDAAVLSAIAQAVTHDYSAVKDPAEHSKWVEFSKAMRDSAGELNAQLHQKNRRGAEDALEKMTKSCDQCHAVFRKQLLPTKQ